MKNTFSPDLIKAFFRRYGRYVGAAALFVVLVLLVVNFTTPVARGSSSTGNGPAVRTSGDSDAEIYSVDADEAINELIAKYYEYYANGDIDGLSTLATPISDSEKSFIQMYASYVDSYENLSCYTKSGLSEGSYLVSVYLEIKFDGAETLAPGLDFFYVETNDEGNYYINNLYSQYNSLTKELPTDPAVNALIEAFESQEDVVALQIDVQNQYETAVSSDENLNALINTTIADAYATWAKSLNPTETAEAESETTEATEAAEAEPQEVVVLLTTSRVNLRNAASQTGEVLATLDEGTEVALVSDVGNGWYNVLYNDTNGYIIGDYLQRKDGGADATTASETTTAETTQDDGGAGETTGGGPSGTVTMNEHNGVAVRSSASSDADSIGTAYTGDQVKILENLDSGWSKIEWNGQTGYMKTDLIG